MPLTLDHTPPTHTGPLSVASLLAMPAGSVGVMTGKQALPTPLHSEPDPVSVALLRLDSAPDDPSVLVAGLFEVTSTKHLIAPLELSIDPIAWHLTDAGPVDLLARIAPLPGDGEAVDFVTHPKVAALIDVLDALPDGAVVVLGDWAPRVWTGMLAIKYPAVGPLTGWRVGSGEDALYDIEELAHQIGLRYTIPDMGTEDEDEEDPALAEFDPATTLRLLPYRLAITDSHDSIAS